MATPDCDRDGSVGDATCGLKCWLAEEDICKCYCGGQNHGLMLKGIMPKRMAKIDGVMYELVDIASYFNMYKLIEQADVINKQIIRVKTPDYTYYYHYTDKNAPMRIKKASKSQEQWTEIKTLIDNADCVGNRYIYCLWKKIER